MVYSAMPDSFQAHEGLEAKVAEMNWGDMTRNQPG